MQNEDGGWGAFDKDCDNEVLTYIPFADHNAMIDPSCEDITGRALEALHALGVPAGPPGGAPRRGVPRAQAGRRTGPGTAAGAATTSTDRGSRCGASLHAGEDLRAAALPERRPTGSARCQNADGGWGELPHSYDDPTTKGSGPSTPSQTAWALWRSSRPATATPTPCAAASSTCSPTSSTTAPGRTSTGPRTGFPKVFYLRYHLYATYFPLWALALYAREAAAGATVRRRTERGAAVAVRRTDHGVN